MSKMDQNHPCVLWLKGIGKDATWLSLELGKRSPATAYRWIRAERLPGPSDQERIAELSKGADEQPRVPVSCWHEWWLKAHPLQVAA